MAEPLYSLRGKRVYIAGQGGMAGRAIARRLASTGCDLIDAPRAAVDLESQSAVSDWFAAHRPQAVFLAAAKVGGISANDSLPVDFLDRNLRIAANVLAAAHATKVEKLLFLGSSCIYPRDAVQPMTEEALLTGPLEPTNQWYAIAKIAGIKLCEAYRQQYGDDFISVMPTNLYGPGDNYHPEHSHVPAALIRRFHEAKGSGAPEVEVWGTGAPRREFLHVDDMADACVFAMERYSGAGMLNIGTGSDVTIAAFARLVADVVGYSGELKFNANRPDGTPRKLLDVSKLAALGWRARIALREGLASAYADFLKGGWREV
jgi:GDP-L-fucose synthase